MPSTESAPLADVLEHALTRPVDLRPATLDAILGALDPKNASPWAPALAALVYARPDLATPVLVDRVATLLASPSVGESAALAAATVLEALIPTELSGHVLTALERLLPDERLAAPVRSRLVTLLRAFVSWRPELLSLTAFIDLAAAPTLEPHRDVLVGQILEPLLVIAPHRVTDELLDRMMTVFGDCPRLRYALIMLGERVSITPTVRSRAAGLVRDAFPLRAAARAVLDRKPFDLLVVINVRIGQGDELVRLVPLVQAMLDAHPTLQAVLVTKRCYLYDHPRVRPVPILDDVAVDTALTLLYAGIVHISEPGPRDVPWRPDLDARVRDLIATQRPVLVITGDVGFNHFIYRTVVLDGRGVAHERALDRLAVDNIYDPIRRLLVELGLWAPVGEESSDGMNLLTATPSADAERVWSELTRGLTPPVALVNPFGGMRRTKGYPPDRPDRLAAELTDLVREGYAAVLIPNGTPWGRETAARAVLARLEPGIRARVRIAPDPAETDPRGRMVISERPELPYADGIMRLFKYFVVRADHVVTVEGWLGHLAYLLGRPFRIVLQAQSYGFEWHPPLRGPRQRLGAALSLAGRRAGPDTLGADDLPPLPPRDRKPLLQAALAGLDGIGSPRAVPILERGLASEDHEVRASAVAALGRLADKRARDRVLMALRDAEPLVRWTAAEALLGSGVDCTRELGPQFREQLTAHRDIARQAWASVLRLGAPALPALFVAADGENDAIRREARYVLRRLMVELHIGPFTRSG